MICVEIKKRGIYAVPGFFKCLAVAYRSRLGRGGACAGVDRINAGASEERDALFAGRKRKRAVFVFQKNDALALDSDGELFCRREKLCAVCVIGSVIVCVERSGVLVLSDHCLTLSEVHVHYRAERPGQNDVYDDAQDK